MKQSGLDISRVGKAVMKANTTNLFNGIPITDFESHIWLLHSSEKMLMNYLLKGRQHYKQLYMFHNYKGRLNKFIKNLHQSGYTGRITAV